MVPVIGLFGLYGAWVLRDRSVCFGRAGSTESLHECAAFHAVEGGVAVGK